MPNPYCKKIENIYFQHGDNLISPGSIWYLLCIDYYKQENKHDFSRLFSRNNFYYLPFNNSFLSYAHCDQIENINLEDERKRTIIKIFSTYFSNQIYNVESRLTPLLHAFLTYHPEYLCSLPAPLVKQLKILPYKIEINDQQDIAYGLTHLKRYPLFLPVELVCRLTMEHKVSVCEEYTNLITQKEVYFPREKIDLYTDFYADIHDFSIGLHNTH
jgi:hypothetical protein